MSQGQSKQLIERTREVYEEVVQGDKSESVLEALQRTEELVSNSGSEEDLRACLARLCRTS